MFTRPYSPMLVVTAMIAMLQQWCARSPAWWLGWACTLEQPSRLVDTLTAHPNTHVVHGYPSQGPSQTKRLPCPPPPPSPPPTPPTHPSTLPLARTGINAVRLSTPPHAVYVATVPPAIPAALSQGVEI